MITSSFTYNYIIPVAGETREPVLVDIDFGPVFPGGRSQVILEYLGISGMRQNSAGDMQSSGAFSARILGRFDSNNAPIYAVNAPRSGDSVASFDGIAFSSSSPFLPWLYSTVLLPRTFQIEFIPSNQRGSIVGDSLVMFVTIGYSINP